MFSTSPPVGAEVPELDTIHRGSCKEQVVGLGRMAHTAGPLHGATGMHYSRLHPARWTNAVCILHRSQRTK